MPQAARPFDLPASPAVSAGPGAAGRIGEALGALGATRAFVVTDPGCVTAGVAQPVLDALTAAGVDHAVFSDVDPNPTDANVAAGVAALTEFGEAAVVLVGGGSAMDCGKYLALAAPHGHDGLDFAFHPQLTPDDTIDFGTVLPPRFPERDGYPTVAVPTTSGTASETNGGGLITDTADNRKLTFSHDSIRPRHVLLDPTLTLGLPPVPTATSGMDALTHAIEAFTSTGANPYADALALGAIESVARWLPAVVDDPSDLEARAQMQVASHLAGLAFSSGPLLGLVHATGHPISGRLHQAHGQTLSTMLPHVMRFNLEVCEERYARVGQALGVPESGSTRARAEGAIAAVEALSARVGTDRSLTDLGGDDAVVDLLVEDALRDLIILTTPRYPSRAEVRALYEAAR